jgi:hypothetical protein
MVYKAGESTLDPNKIEINIQQEEAPAPDAGSGYPGAAPTEQEQQQKTDDAAKSLQDAFKAPSAAPEAPKK